MFFYQKCFADFECRPSEIESFDLSLATHVADPAGPSSWAVAGWFKSCGQMETRCFSWQIPWLNWLESSKVSTIGWTLNMVIHICSDAIMWTVLRCLFMPFLMGYYPCSRDTEKLPSISAYCGLVGGNGRPTGLGDAGVSALPPNIAPWWTISCIQFHFSACERIKVHLMSRLFLPLDWMGNYMKLLFVQKGCDQCLLVSLDGLSLYELDFRQFSKSEKHQLGDVFLREPGHKFVSKHGRACNGSAWRRSWHSKFWQNGSITINYINGSSRVSAYFAMNSEICVSFFSTSEVTSTNPTITSGKYDSMRMHQMYESSLHKSNSSGSEWFLFVRGKLFSPFFGDLFSYTTFTRTQRWRSASRTPHHGLPVTNNLPVWPRSMLSHRDRGHLSPYKPLAASVLQTFQS